MSKNIKKLMSSHLWKKKHSEGTTPHSNRILFSPKYNFYLFSPLLAHPLATLKFYYFFSLLKDKLDNTWETAPKIWIHLPSPSIPGAKHQILALSTIPFLIFMPLCSPAHQSHRNNCRPFAFDQPIENSLYKFMVCCCQKVKNHSQLICSLLAVRTHSRESSWKLSNIGSLILAHCLMILAYIS